VPTTRPRARSTAGCVTSRAESRKHGARENPTPERDEHARCRRASHRSTASDGEQPPTDSSAFIQGGAITRPDTGQFVCRGRGHRAEGVLVSSEGDITAEAVKVKQPRRCHAARLRQPAEFLKAKIQGSRGHAPRSTNLRVDINAVLDGADPAGRGLPAARRGAVKPHITLRKPRASQVNQSGASKESRPPGCYQDCCQMRRENKRAARKRP
jgi:hypothetical protein